MYTMNECAKQRMRFLRSKFQSPRILCNIDFLQGTCYWLVIAKILHNTVSI